MRKERDKLGKQLDELRRFDEQLRHNADQRIALDLDDGAKVNYGEFGTLLAEVKAVSRAETQRRREEESNEANRKEATKTWGCIAVVKSTNSLSSLCVSASLREFLLLFFVPFSWCRGSASAACLPRVEVVTGQGAD